MKKIFKALFAIAVVIGICTPIYVYADNSVNTRTIPTSGGNRTVTYVTINFNAGLNYEIRALSAQDSFGRPSATLSEFVAAANLPAGSDAVIFPVNFFVTETHEIIGAVISQGMAINAGPQPWLNWGVGFTPDNTMSFFNGRLGDSGYIYGKAWDDPRLPYATAFNIYPHLILNGQRANIQAAPGMTQAWLNGRVRRSFMGQRSDGTFIVGTADGTNITELQDIAMYLNLYNATNIDGGASASIWHNGAYILRPGRQLASVMVINSTTNTSQPRSAGFANFMSKLPPDARVLRFTIGSTIFLNQESAQTLEIAPFITEGRTMVPLRVISEAFGATGLLMTDGMVSFEIDGRTFELSIGQPLPNSMGTPMIIDGHTFVPLRYIIDELGGDVYWDRLARAVYIRVG